jgi:DNA-binding CsgD family transcriptional regulator
MPRRRRLDIAESPAALSRLERKLRSGPLATRVRALQVMKRFPELVTAEVALRVGVSAPTVERWVATYRGGGLDALLEVRPPGRPRSAPGTAPRGGRPSIAVGSTGAPRAADPFLCLLNALPNTFDVTTATRELRNALAPLLPAVDRIAIAVDTSCDLCDPDEYNASADVIHHVPPKGSVGVSVSTHAASRGFSAAVLDGMLEQGFPFDDYHPPHVIELAYYETMQIGCIILCRERQKSPLREADTAIIETLRPFLESAFAGVIIRHQFLRPQERLIDDVLVEATVRYQLTHQERRVLTCRMLGLSYKEIAAEIGVSQDNVKKHLQSVHRKTGTVSLGDVFGKLFMLRPTR